MWMLCGKALSDVPDSDRLRFLHQVKHFTVSSVTYLIEKIQNFNLDLLEYVSPYKIKDPSSTKSITKIAKLFLIEKIDENAFSVN